MNDLRDLELMILSRFPIIVIETYEELRVLELLERLSSLREMALFSWSVTDGIVRKNLRREVIPETYEARDALRHIDKSPQNGIFVLLDFHPFLEDPVNIRLIKNIAQNYYKTPRTLIFISHRLTLPPELERLSARFQLSIPDVDQVRALVKEEIQLWAHRTGTPVKGQRDAVELLIQHVLGLTADDVKRLVRFAIQNDGAVTMRDIPRVLTAKHDLLNRNGLLGLELEVSKFSDVAGLAHLKRWVEQRRVAMLGEAGKMGLDAPKGIMILGVQGSGKSLAAKAVAGTWGLPLLRLDFGALYNKFFGETERNLREALATADAMAPCVLWIDEIEKSMAQDTDGGDSGVSQRVLGSLLTWMAERKSRVFIVATANDIQLLPPELIRKGRLDEVFFVDLPDREVRAEVLRIHLQRRNHKPEDFDIETLAQRSEGFSGAEIEQAVVAALYEAHALNEPLATKHIEAEMARTKPLSVLMSERLAGLRAWAQGRTVLAG
jgi:SpoVK/Ycf46/Vps4 family AAA+-type ATPase